MQHNRLYWGIEGATDCQKLHLWRRPESVVNGLISGWKPSVLLNSISVFPLLKRFQTGVISSATVCTLGSPNLTKAMNDPAKDPENCALLNGGPLYREAWTKSAPLCLLHCTLTSSLGSNKPRHCHAGQAESRIDPVTYWLLERKI